MGLVIVSVVVTALAVEFYKKGIRGKKVDGVVKTSASKWEIYVVALVASVAWGFALTSIQHPGQWVWAPVYVAIVYFFQWLVDMKLVKEAVNALIKKMEV